MKKKLSMVVTLIVACLFCSAQEISTVYTNSSTSSTNQNNVQQYASYVDSYIEGAIFYKAASFKDMKLSGNYGFRLSFCKAVGPLGSNFYLGGTVQGFAFNFGLMPFDYTCDEMGLGINIGTATRNQIAFFSVPITILCAYYGSSAYKKLTGSSVGWGMDIIPQVSVGGKFRVNIGLDIAVPFGGGDASVGLYTAISYGSFQ